MYCQLVLQGGELQLLVLLPLVPILAQCPSSHLTADAKMTFNPRGDESGHWYPREKGST